MRDKYHIDFALTMLAGNEQRYLRLRPLVEEDSTIIPRWYPIRTYFEDDPFRFLPGNSRFWARHLADSRKLFLNTPADAVVMHTLETYYLFALQKRLLKRDILIIYNPDEDIPIGDHYKLAVEETDLFIPWTNIGAQKIKQRFPNVPDENIQVIHPGLNLKDWPMTHKGNDEERLQVLFIGGDFLRKGGDTLLEAFEAELGKTCDLHLITQIGWLDEKIQSRIEQAPFVYLHLGLDPSHPEFVRLITESDMLILPSNLECIPWVTIEALATGLPVIATPIYGTPDVVQDEKTGLLIPPKSPQAIIEAVTRLGNDPNLCQQFSKNGRKHVEEQYNARKNTDRFLSLIKSRIDQKENKNGL